MHFKCYKKFKMNCASRIYLKIFISFICCRNYFYITYTLLKLIMMKKFYCCILDDNLLKLIITLYINLIIKMIITLLKSFQNILLIMFEMSEVLCFSNSRN